MLTFMLTALQEAIRFPSSFVKQLTKNSYVIVNNVVCSDNFSVDFSSNMFSNLLWFIPGFVILGLDYFKSKKTNK